MSLTSLKFPKAANLLVNSIWYFFLNFSSFSFLRLNFSPSNSCAACLLLPTFPWLLQPPDSDQYHSQLLWNLVHLVYLNTICYLSIYANLVVSLPIRRIPTEQTKKPFWMNLRSKFHAAKHRLHTQNISSNFSEARFNTPWGWIRNMSEFLIVF